MFRFSFCWKVAIALVAAVTVTDGSVQQRTEVRGIRNTDLKHPQGFILEAAAAAGSAGGSLNASGSASGARPKGARSTKRNRVGIEFVLIPAGTFRMGSSSDDAVEQEEPVTEVRISRAFYMGKHEVTQKQWEKVMGTNPSAFKGCKDCPVEHVSWNDVQAFIRTLNGMEDSKRYRLPTEAEWEYAARGGTDGDRYSTNLDTIAWYDKNCNQGPHRVGKKAPNGYGLHDMLGNVYEWVQDWKGPYPGGSVTDPQGPARGKLRTMRGGSWEAGKQSCRATHRLDATPGFRFHALGLRLLMEAR